MLRKLRKNSEDNGTECSARKQLPDKGSFTF